MCDLCIRNSAHNYNCYNGHYIGCLRYYLLVAANFLHILYWTVLLHFWHFSLKIKSLECLVGNLVSTHAIIPWYGEIEGGTQVSGVSQLTFCNPFLQSVKGGMVAQSA